MLFCINRSYAATYYINDASTTGDVFCSAAGNDATGTGTAAAPYATFTALDAAKSFLSGDIIYVDAGTYNGWTNITVTVALTIQGAGNQITIIDNNYASSGYLFAFTTNVTLKDLKIKRYQNNSSASPICLQYSAPGGNLYNVIISDCRATPTSGGGSFALVVVSTGTTSSTFIMEGGGIFCTESSSAFGSGGVDILGSNLTATFNNVTFSGLSKTNMKYLNGAAVAIGAAAGSDLGTSTFNFNNCLFSGNTVVSDATYKPTAAAIYCRSNAGTIAHKVNISDCKFYGNTANYSGTGSFGSTCYFYNGTATISNSLFDSNSITGSSGTVKGTVATYQATLNLDTCKFISNTASTANDVYIENTSGTVNAYDCYFSSSSNCNDKTAGTFNISYCGSPTRSGIYNTGWGSYNLSAQRISFTDPTVPAPSGDCSSGYTLTNPVSVTATIGTFGPTEYASLYLAFAAINSGIHRGAVSVTINGDINDITTAGLNASGVGSSSYTSVTVNPNGNRVVKGPLAAGSPLIELTGADNVTIDGLNDGSNTLTLVNTTVSSTSGTSTIRLITGATNNTITNCNLYSCVTGDVTSVTGTVLFSTDVSGSGNDNNTITGNNFGRYNGTSYTKCIYSLGTSSRENSSNNISSNNFYDYFSATESTSAIYISSNSTDWTITSNKFYQTATRTQTSGVQHSAIWISNTSGNNFTITSNTIGYSSSSQTGTYTFVGHTSSGSRFIPIYLNVGTTTASNVKSNTITAIAISAATNSVNQALPGTFSGIAVLGGAVNIGSSGQGNVIGSSSANSAITYYSGTSGNYWYGIYSNSNGTVSITYNTIGGIATHSSSGNTIAYIFYGIYTHSAGSGATTISYNYIGSSSASNSIAMGLSTSGSVGCELYGVMNKSTGTANIIGNTMNNCIVYGTSATNLYGFATTSGADNMWLYGNTLSNSTNYSNGSAGSTYGIYCTVTASMRVSNNTVNDITHNNGLFRGVYLSAGTSNSEIYTVDSNRVKRINIGHTSVGVTDGNLVGIYILSNGNTHNLTNNYVSEFTATPNNNTIFYNLQGIYIAASTGQPACNLTFNTVQKMKNGSTGTSTANSVSGIEISSTSTTAAVLKRNIVRYLSITNANANASILGIGVTLKSHTFINNFIYLSNSDGTSTYTQRVPITALSLGSGTSAHTLYYNTIVVGGNSGGTSPNNDSYCVYSLAGGTSSTMVFRNNIFQNTRATSDQANIHHRVLALSPTSNSYTVTLSNNYYVGNNYVASPTTQGDFAQINSTKYDYNTAGWTTVAGTGSTTATTGLTIAATSEVTETSQITNITDLYSNSSCREDLYANASPRTTNPQTSSACHMGCYEGPSLIELPVALLNFKGERRGSTNVLLWTTIMEFNNKMFVVESCSDGDAWQCIGKVIGNGNSNTTLHYQFTDTMPYRPISYYRLKQIDIDGKVHYSNPICLTSSDIPYVLNFHPNPVLDRIFIKYSELNDFPVQINMYTLNGELLSSYNIQSPEDLLNGLLIADDLPTGGLLLLELITSKGTKCGAKFYRQK